MDSFANTGDWFKESGVEKVQEFKIPLRYGCLLSVLFWVLLVLIPFFYFALNVLISGNLFYIALLVIPFGLRKSNIQISLKK